MRKKPLNAIIGFQSFLAMLKLNHFGSKFIKNLYDGTSQYLSKTVLYFCKRTFIGTCYQNIYAEWHAQIHSCQS